MTSLLTWDRSQIAGDMRFGFLAGRRVATVAPGSTVATMREWELTFLLPGPRGLLGVERGFKARESAQERAEELAAGFMADMRRILQSQ
ncbi:hypothetical protein GCM10022252_03530 [Streptosporangium oxazolinicum]|uniref:Uncharacterized protein n=1 Tax=Streptosporangium oxazolinicum TaxID=909287 RepID=A0ABP8A9S4_9ACTN